jgi:hypothetical protein
MMGAPGFPPEAEGLVLAISNGLVAMEVLRDLILCALHEAEDSDAVRRRMVEALTALEEGAASLNLEAEADA